MNTFLNSFPISLLLRGVFAGAFFIFSYCVATWKSPMQRFTSGNIFTVALPVALVAGVTIYGLHRAFPYPVVEWIFNLKGVREFRKERLPLISDNTIGVLVTRCDDKAKAPERRLRERVKYMELWADYIHLQYTSGWCIIAGSITGAIISDQHFLDHPINHWLCGIVIMFFIASLVSNWRWCLVEEYMIKNPPDKTDPPKATAEGKH